MGWVSETSTPPPVTGLLQQGHASSNRATPPIPSQRVHQLENKHSNILASGAILIQTTTDTEID